MDMNILDYLDKNTVILGLKPKSKKSILSTILDHLILKNKIKKTDKNNILKKLLQREEMGSTAIGGSIALPHARIEKIKKMQICISISPEGVNFNSLDQDPVKIIVLILSNQKEAGLHLKMLALLARMLKDKYFVKQLINVNREEELVAYMDKQQGVMK